jgi:Arc/MetJ family transcription regulator
MSPRRKSKSKMVSEAVLTAPRLGGRKKTLRLDQALLDSARRALGVRTETDAVTRALEAVVRRERQAQALRVLASLGPIDSGRVDD